MRFIKYATFALTFALSVVLTGGTQKSPKTPAPPVSVQAPNPCVANYGDLKEIERLFKSGCAAVVFRQSVTSPAMTPTAKTGRAVTTSQRLKE